MEDLEGQVLTVRSYDQIRADSLVDMLLASDLTTLASKQAMSAETIKARVQVFTPRARVEETFDEAKLQDLHDRQVPAAALAGYGPIDTETARLLAGIAASWDVPEVNPDTGDVITVDTYRPSAAQRRFLAARDLHCRFPGCRVPIRKCDIDHTVAAAEGGETSTKNLAGLCRLHHTMKHATPWQVTQHANGDLDWVSPTGRPYRDRPPSRVRFRSASQGDQCDRDERRTPPGRRHGAGAGAGAAAGARGEPATAANHREPAAAPY
ncbi:MAG: HNH endonuclease [Microbacteriaceae bacterium]|nr:HNH endonuclease [Microbacteriaceae bacterium]